MSLEYNIDHEWINQISDLKLAKETLQENLSAIESILETTQDGFWRANLQGELIDVNPAYIQKSGYSREELLKMHIRDLEATMNATEIADRIERLMKNDHDLFETRHRRKDGSVWDTEVSLSLSKTAGGYFFAFLRDITDRKQIQEQLIQSENRWKFAIEGSGDALWELNLQTGASFYSRRYKEMLGFTEDDPWIATDEEWFKRVHPNDMPGLFNTMQPYIDGKSGTVEVEFRMMGKDGRWLWILGRGMVASRDSNGKAVNLIGVNSDITERKMAQDTLHRNQAMLARTESIAHIGSWEWDVATDTVTWSDEMFRIFKRNPADGSPPFAEHDKLYDPSNLQRLHEAVGEAIHHGTPYELELIPICTDGVTRICLVRGQAVMNADGQVTRLFGSLQDITERKQMEEQVRQLAFYDSLTQLPNRRMLFDRLSQAMAASKRSLRYGAVMILDLDNFKPVNDQHGHLVGDLLLVEAARRLSGCVREVDTVARFGGDEFVVLLSGLDVEKAPSAAQAQVIAEKIRIALSAPFVLNTQDHAQTTVMHHCSVSIGIVLFVNTNASQEEILKWADRAMYLAKTDGRNTIRIAETNG